MATLLKEKSKDKKKKTKVKKRSLSENEDSQMTKDEMIIAQSSLCIDLNKEEHTATKESVIDEINIDLEKRLSIINDERINIKDDVQNENVSENSVEASCPIVENAIESCMPNSDCQIDNVNNEKQSEITFSELIHDSNKKLAEIASENQKYLNRIATVDDDIKNITQDKVTSKEIKANIIKPINEVNTYEGIEKIKTATLTPFGFNEIEEMFGSYELMLTRDYSIKFELQDDAKSIKSHPLYEHLSAYKSAYTTLRTRRIKLADLLTETGKKQNELWIVNRRVTSVHGECSDGQSVELKASYDEAEYKQANVAKLKTSLKVLKDEVVEGYTLGVHNLSVMKLEIEDMLSDIGSNVYLLKEALQVIFHVLRMSSSDESDVDRVITQWAYALTCRLVHADPSLLNLLYVLHHLMRLPISLRWAYSLIQLSISSSNDVTVAWCILETIIMSRAILNKGNAESEFAKSIVLNNEKVLTPEKNVRSCVPLSPKNSIDQPGDNVWLLVDEEGESPDVDAVIPDGHTLRERDLIGLVRQIPFRDIFKKLMIVKEGVADEKQTENGISALVQLMSVYKSHTSPQSSCPIKDFVRLYFLGEGVGSNMILKVFCAARVLLDIVRQGLVSYPGYRAFIDELCRLVVQTVDYCTDLWEAARSKCQSANLDRLMLEYDNTVRAAWLVLKCSSASDVSAIYMPKLPFQHISISAAGEFYSEVISNMNISGNNECYHKLCAISRLAVAQRNEEFAIEVANYLFKLGLISEHAKTEIGAWARPLCGSVMRANPTIYPKVIAALLVSHNAGDDQPKAEWLSSLQLCCWKPSAQQLIEILEDWSHFRPNLLPAFIKSMDWSCETGSPLPVQREVAIFLTKLAKSQILATKIEPEWIYDVILSLKLHCVDWKLDPNIVSDPDQELLCNESPSAILVSVLTTSWGHSVPVVCESGLRALTRLVRTGRVKESLHGFYYVMVMMTMSPESISLGENFKSFLSALLAAERSYSSVATRFLGSDTSVPVTNMLSSLIRSHLTHTYLQLSHPSPAMLLACWLRFLTTMEDWSSNATLVNLMEEAITTCYHSPESMAVLDAFFRHCIQIQLNASPSSSPQSTWSWLTSSKTAYQGLVPSGGPTCPHLWLASLSTEHSWLERGPGLWERLMVTVSGQRGGKVNVDSALKSIGGPTNGSGLAIYRSAQFACSSPPSHPITVALWHLFFTLYMDKPLEQSAPDDPPVGPLFLSGISNRRFLSQIRKSLNDLKQYHDNQYQVCAAKLRPDVLDNVNTVDVDKDRVYHDLVSRQMAKYIKWLDTDYSKKQTKNWLHLLTQGSMESQIYNIMDVINEYLLRRRNDERISLWPHAIIKNLMSTKPSVDLETDDIRTEVSQRVIERLKTHPEPQRLDPEKHKLEPLLDSSWFSNGSDVVLKDIREILEELVAHATDFVEEVNGMNSMVSNLLELSAQLYVQVPFSRQEYRSCGNKCTGAIKLSIQGMEWRLNPAVQSDMERNFRSRSLALQSLMQVRPRVAKLCGTLARISREICCGRLLNEPNKRSGPVQVFRLLLRCMDDIVSSCPPIADSLNTVTTQIGERFVSADSNMCAELISCSANPTLVNRLISPHRLPPAQVVHLYSVVLEEVNQPDLAFSYLTKFDLEHWLTSVQHTPETRLSFIGIILKNLCRHGSSPPEANGILQELLLVHLSAVMKLDLQAHLVWVVSEVARQSAHDQLPPVIWDTVAALLRDHRGDLNMAMITQLWSITATHWWSARRSLAPSCALGARARYAAPALRFNQILLEGAIETARLGSVIDAGQAVREVFSGTMMVLNAWLVPCYDQQNPAASPLLPWASQDAELAADVICRALYMALQTILCRCEDGEAELLRQTWCWHYAHLGAPPHHASAESAAKLVRAELLKLPWERHHWFHYDCLEMARQMVAADESCRRFVAVTLGSIQSPDAWLHGTTPENVSYALYILFYLFLSLPFDQEVLDTVVDSLPWEQLNAETFEHVLNLYFSTNHTDDKPCHQRENFRLIRAAATLTQSSSLLATHACYGGDCASKRHALLQRWSGLLLRAKTAEGVRSMLDAVKETAIGRRAAEALSKDEECIEICSAMLAQTSVALCMSQMNDVVLRAWKDWLRTCPIVCLKGVIANLPNITKNETFVTLAQCLLENYLKNGGDWEYLLNRWRNLLLQSYLLYVKEKAILVMYTAIRLKIQSGVNFEVRDFLSDGVMQALKGFVSTIDNEEQVALLTCFLVSNLPYDSSDVQDVALMENVLTILEGWAQEPKFGLLKILGLTQDTAPSHGFRLVARFGICAVNIKLQRDERATAAANTILAMLRYSSCHPIRLQLTACLELLADKQAVADNLKRHMHSLCEDLYPSCKVMFELERPSADGNIVAEIPEKGVDCLQG